MEFSFTLVNGIGKNTYLQKLPMCMENKKTKLAELHLHLLELKDSYFLHRTVQDIEF